MNFNNINEYLDYCSGHIDEKLTELEKETHLKTTHPHMISGHHQGRVLSFLSKLIQPKSILEIGTFTGYSTLCLAEGLSENGHIVTIDHNDELSYFHNKYLIQSNWSNQITIKIGEAKKIIPDLNDSFDLIFIDADKESYPEYYNLLLPKLSSKGLMLVDNVLWYEKVLSEPDPSDLLSS